jgi:putative phosphoribosyl transferase
LAARKKGANRIVVAAPVGSTNAIHRLENVADEVRVLVADPQFEAVGRYYATFSQTSDEEVLEWLKGQRQPIPND